MAETDLSALPDYPSLCQLARALWRGGTMGGAAVMVGAGFSRNALLSGADTPKPPMWGDLAAKMAAQLYPLEPEDAPRDPLRLAEEYRVYLGQAALDELIRTSIADDRWHPGRAHRALLELPWADVLTTNWDTLLERGAREVSVRSYEIVRSQADLPHARAPRIVKLHGSIGTSESFVLAEEDFRRYPADQAALVNLARQVFLENELCLVGFSGDDPNFLQWSGWVRDQLAGNARRIYLVGALSLGAAKRKFLEARNIAPIDLSPSGQLRSLDPQDRPAAAMKAFLDYLKRAKPPAARDWQPAYVSDSGEPFVPPVATAAASLDPSKASAIIERVSSSWRRDRESYPGWLVCPAVARQDMIVATNMSFFASEVLLGSLDRKPEPAALYELAWRHVTSFAPFEPRLAAALATAADPGLSVGLPLRQRLEIACWLLEHHRQSGDRTAFDYWARMVEANSPKGSDELAAVKYQRLLGLRDNLDFAELCASLGEPGGEDPVWKLRWAALHDECGHADQAERLVVSVLAELRGRQCGDRTSIWIRSRLAWALWLSQAHLHRQRFATEEEWPSEFREARCDPWIEIEALERTVGNALRKRRDEEGNIEPKYDAGTYRDKRTTIQFGSSNDVEPLRALDRLIDTVGIPIRTGMVNIVGGVAQDAADLGFAPTAAWYITLLKRMKSFSEASLDRHFSRLAVAALPAELVDRLWTAARGAVEFWWARKVIGDEACDRYYVEEQLRINLELLSRLVARRGTKDAIWCMTLARDLGRQPKILPWLLHEQIGDLLARAQSAIGPLAPAEAVLLALDFPLSCEVNARPERWPNPVELLAMWRPGVGCGRPVSDAAWTSRISALLDILRGKTIGRAEAGVRLTSLADGGVLTAGERTSLGEGLWSQLDSSGPPWPADLTLYPHVIARLPAPPGYAPGAEARARLFDDSLKPNDFERLSAIVAAALDGGDFGKSVLPDPMQAARLFDEIAAIAADGNTPGTPAAMFGRATREAYERLATQALGCSVVPGLQREDVSVDRLNALQSLAARLPAGNVLESLPNFTFLGNAVATEVSSKLRRALAGPQAKDIHGAVLAIVKWAATGAFRGSPRHCRGSLIQRVVGSRPRHGQGGC